MNILGIETSCDETAVAIVQEGSQVLSSVVSSSQALHAQFGGILPELASRKQFEFMLPCLTQALREAFPADQSLSIQQVIQTKIDAIAVTIGPGLIGSLLIGVETAKTLAWLNNKPIIPVNHVLAHPYANFLSKTAATMDFPAIALVVSGGHTELYLMQSDHELIWLGGTIDDAAGEAFDKSARLLGLPYGGGQAIETIAQEYRPELFTQLPLTLPRPLLHAAGLDFSFSGLKTAIQRAWKNESYSVIPERQRQILFAHHIQAAITDVLVVKTIQAANLHSAKSLIFGGGVSANKHFRSTMQTIAASKHLTCYFPPIELCTDNAAVIACYAYFHFSPHNYREISATPSLSVETNLTIDSKAS
jgi:N6-L-threonylcarbamoyladenine synthase